VVVSVDDDVIYLEMSQFDAFVELIKGYYYYDDEMNEMLGEIAGETMEYFLDEVSVAVVDLSLDN
jgi:hypothetical protein